jgi:hypothetical protein
MPYLGFPWKWTCQNFLSYMDSYVSTLLEGVLSQIVSRKEHTSWGNP